MPLVHSDWLIEVGLKLPVGCFGPPTLFGRLAGIELARCTVKNEVGQRRDTTSVARVAHGSVDVVVVVVVFY